MTPKFGEGDRVRVVFSREDYVAEVLPDWTRNRTGTVKGWYIPDAYVDTPYYTVQLDDDMGTENYPEHVLRRVDA